MPDKEISMVAPSSWFGYSGNGKAHIVTSVTKAAQGIIYTTRCGRQLLDPVHGPLKYKEEKRPIKDPRIFSFDTCLSCINNTEGTRQSFKNSMKAIRKQRETVHKQTCRTWSNNRRHCPHLSGLRCNKCDHPIRRFYLNRGAPCTYDSCPYIGIKL